MVMAIPHFNGSGTELFCVIASFLPPGPPKRAHRNSFCSLDDRVGVRHCIGTYLVYCLFVCFLFVLDKD